MEKIIKLTGRIDSNNIADIEEKISADIKNFQGEIVFDAKELEYISSAGLRMILRIKKSNDKTKVINCNPTVYEIFEITGFSEMMDISKGVRSITVDNCEVIGDGFYGTVYRLDPETIVKVYKKPDCLDMVKREKELSRKAFVLGIPTAIPYDTVKVGDSYGSVFELLDCKSLDKLIKEGASIEDLSKECVKILKKIHTTQMEPGELPNRKDQIIEMANSCKSYLSEETNKNLLTFINNIEDKNTMIHGDFHIKNLMKQDNEILIIDMDTLSYGNPLFEFGAMYATYIAFACINHNNPIEFLGITYEQSEEIWNNIFNFYYEDKTEEEKEKLLKQIKIISYLEVLFIRTKFNDGNNKFSDKEIEFCTNYLTNNLPELVS